MKMDSNNAGTQKFNNVNNDELRQDNSIHHHNSADIEKLLQQKENAEKEANYFKDHYHNLKVSMDDLLKMAKESSQNKNDLKSIIEQKDKIINALKSNTNSGSLREELLNATEKLAQEKKQCLKFQTELNKVNDTLKNCNSEKLKLSNKLEQVEIDIRKYETLKEKLSIMVEKQGHLEEHFKRNQEALDASNQQRDAFQQELIKAQRWIEVESKKKSGKINQAYDIHQQIHEKELDEIKRELESYKNRNEELLKQTQIKDKLGYELGQTLRDRTKFNKDCVEIDSNSSRSLKHEEKAKVTELNNLIQNYKAENIKLNNDIAELNKRVLNIETISRDLRNELQEKELSLEEKMRENEELQEKMHNMSDDNKALEQSLHHKLQGEYSEKIQVITQSSEDKENKLLEQLNDIKMQLHESVSRQHALTAGSSTQVMSLENKISLQKQEIINFETENFSLSENIKHLSMNEKNFDSHLDTIKNQLEKVTQERDEKTKIILSLRKMSQQMQSFADQSRDEKKQIYMDNDSLREKAYEAQSRLEALMSEQESHKYEMEILQQKLIELDRNYSLEKVKLKKIENQLKQELAETKSQCTAAVVEKNKKNYEKEMTVKNLKECEKCLANSNCELGLRNSELKKLQREQVDLQGKLLDYRDKITQFNIETDKLLQEKQNYSQSILTLEKSVQTLKKEVMSKSDIIAELSCHHELLKTKNSEYEQIEHDFKELKNVKKLLSQQNSELKEKCTLLDDDLDTLRHKLKEEEKNIEEMQKKNEKLEAVLQISNEENSLLRKATEANLNFEIKNEVLSNKCNSISLACDKLHAELGAARKELIQSREKQSTLEEEVKTLKNSEIESRQKNSCLLVKNDNLSCELCQEKEERVKLAEETKILKSKEILITSDNERLCKENVEFNQLIFDKTLKIDELQTINAELIQKCCDYESKGLIYEEEIQKRTEELKLNVAEYTSLRGKYDILGTKLAKYVSQYKILKQKNSELQFIIDQANEISTNNDKENTAMKIHCQNIETELSKLKSENDKLNGEINLIKSQPERLQHIQEGTHRLMAGVKSTPKIKLPIGEDDPVYHLDTLASQVRQSSSPAAKHLLNSCKHIKELIIKERGDANQQ